MEDSCLLFSGFIYKNFSICVFISFSWHENREHSSIIDISYNTLWFFVKVGNGGDDEKYVVKKKIESLLHICNKGGY